MPDLGVASVLTSTVPSNTISGKSNAASSNSTSAAESPLAGSTPVLNVLGSLPRPGLIPGMPLSIPVPLTLPLSSLFLTTGDVDTLLLLLVPASGSMLTAFGLGAGLVEKRSKPSILVSVFSSGCSLDPTSAVGKLLTDDLLSIAGNLGAESEGTCGGG